MGKKGHIEQNENGKLRFVPPQGKNGKFLPKSKWTKEDKILSTEAKEANKQYRRPVKRISQKEQQWRGSENPIRRTEKVDYFWPRDEKGHFIPKSEMSENELMDLEKAKEMGLFVKRARTREKRKRSKQKNLESMMGQPGMMPYGQMSMGAPVMFQQPIYFPPPFYPPPYQGMYPPFAEATAPRKREEPSLRLLADFVRPQSEEGIIAVGEVTKEIQKKIPELESVPIGTKIVSAPFLAKKGSWASVTKLSRPKKRALARYLSSRYSGVKRNPSTLAIINPKRDLGERFVDTVDYLKERPLLAAAVIAVAFVLTLKGIKGFHNYLSKKYRAVEIRDKALYFPGADPYEMTAMDAQWLASALWASLSADPAFWASNQGKKIGSAALWTIVNQYMTCIDKRQLYPSLSEMIAGEIPISSSHGIDWELAPMSIKKLVKDFVVGFIPNSVGTRTHFRVMGWGYMPHDSMRIGKIVAWTEPGAQIRPDARA